MSDLIDRRAAIEAIQNDVEPFVIVEPGTTHVIGAGVKDADVIAVLETLPSAEPERVVCAEVKLSKEEIQEAVDDAVKKMMAEMAEPERKKGKWVWSDEDASWKCGSCDCVFEEFDWKPEYNYCPNCGSFNGGEQE